MSRHRWRAKCPKKTSYGSTTHMPATLYGCSGQHDVMWGVGPGREIATRGANFTLKGTVLLSLNNGSFVQVANLLTSPPFWGVLAWRQGTSVRVL